MANSVVIRAYQEADRESVVRLWREVFAYPATHNAPELSLERKLAHSPELLLIAEQQGQVIGTVMGGYDGHRGWIYSLAVHPEFRSRLIGSSLMNGIEGELQHRGCVKINLQLLAENHDTVAFYERLGYQVEQRISMGKRLVR